MQFTYELFLILHFLFGEIFNFYVLFNYYDTILHFVTAMLLSILGYSIIHYYFDDNVLFMQLLFAFLFGISCEFFWEILEFSIDHFFNSNMQRFIKNGIILTGHEAISDTIKDMVVAIIGCVIGVLSFFFGRKEKGEASSYKMGQIDEKLATISNQIEKLSQKLDNYDMEIDSRIEKAIEIHIQTYHKGE